MLNFLREVIRYDEKNISRHYPWAWEGGGRDFKNLILLEFEI